MHSEAEKRATSRSGISQTQTSRTRSRTRHPRRPSRIVSVKAGVDYTQEVYFYPLLMRKSKAPRELSVRARNLLARKRVALIDAQVMALYRDELARCGLLKDAEFIALPPGEKAKTMRVLGRVLRMLAELSAHRDTHIVLAVGGGALLDVASLAANLYQRGLPLIHIPTTLLAMVDATVGGKTAVNMPLRRMTGETPIVQGTLAKNMAGTFYPPAASIIDTRFLRTLSTRRLKDGLVEALKMGILAGEPEFSRIRGAMDGALALEAKPLTTLIRTALSIKARYVAADLTDEGARRELNFGHTLGHALEAHPAFRLTHGEAVAAGMEFACELSEKLGVAKSPSRRGSGDQGSPALAPIRDALAELKVRRPREQLIRRHFRELWRLIESDKKHGERSPRFILPVGIGKMRMMEVGASQWYKTTVSS